MSSKRDEHETKAGRAGGLATASKFPTAEDRSVYYAGLGRKGAATTNDPATIQRLADIGRILLSAFERTEEPACPE